MKFEIDKRDFLRGLSSIQSTAGRKTTLPILSHVLIELQKDSLFLTGTDLETGIREELPAHVHDEGKASISAKKLFEIVRELPEEIIHIQKKENHWITLKCGRSIFNLAGLDPDEFPSLPVFRDEFFSKLPCRFLMEMIEKSVFAASNEDSRYHLNGIFFLQTKRDGKEILRMVATDGHRLSLVNREGQAIHGIEKGIIIPKKAVLEIKKIMGDKSGEENVEIYFDGTHGFLRMAKSLMVVRLIDGEFPEYEQVIPKENDKKIVVEKEKIYGCLKRVSTMATERVEGIRLSVKKNSMELNSYNQDFGDAKEEMEVAYEGPDIEIGFNARFLMEVLNVLNSEEVLIELKDEGSPGIIRPIVSKEPPVSLESSDQLYIVMPMRI